MSSCRDVRDKTPGSHTRARSPALSISREPGFAPSETGPEIVSFLRAGGTPSVLVRFSCLGEAFSTKVEIFLGGGRDFSGRFGLFFRGFRWLASRLWAHEPALELEPVFGSLLRRRSVREQLIVRVCVFFFFLLLCRECVCV